MKLGTLKRLLAVAVTASMLTGSFTMAAFAAETEDAAIVAEEAAEEMDDADTEEADAAEMEADEELTTETIDAEEADDADAEETDDGLIVEEGAEETEEVAGDTDDVSEYAEEVQPPEAPASASDEALMAEEDPLSGSGYVLMNIPYADFYAAEGVSNVDVVASATKKSLNPNMAAGSYHASGFTQDTMNDAVILGVTYPVYVEDLGVLAGLKRIKDEDTENLLVMTGKTSSEEREYTGADILFAGGDYAYYILSGEPTNYKTLTVDGNKFSFSAVKNGAVDGGELTGEPTYNGHHTQVTYAVGNEALAGVTVNGVIVTTSDGSKYALRHVWDIWRITELGWNWNDIDGTGLACKNITNVTYYVKADADYKVLSYDVNVTMKLQPAAITAELEEGIKTVKVSGIPADAENAKATVKSKVGRGETPVVLADGAVINDGVIELTDMADYKTTYTVTVLSDNYADMSAAFECASKEKLAAAIEAAKKLAADENLDGETKAALEKAIGDAEANLTAAGEEADAAYKEIAAALTAASAAADQKIADAEYEKAVTEAEELLKDENLSAAGKEALQKAIEEAKAVGRPAFWSA